MRRRSHFHKRDRTGVAIVGPSFLWRSGKPLFQHWPKEDSSEAVRLFVKHRHVAGTEETHDSVNLSWSLRSQHHRECAAAGEAHGADAFLVDLVFFAIVPDPI